MQNYYGWLVQHGAGKTVFATKGNSTIYRDGYDDLLFAIEQRENVGPFI